MENMEWKTEGMRLDVKGVTQASAQYGRTESSAFCVCGKIKLLHILCQKFHLVVSFMLSWRKLIFKLSLKNHKIKVR